MGCARQLINRSLRQFQSEYVPPERNPGVTPKNLR